MTAPGQRVLAPFWFGVLTLPAGMTTGFVNVTLAFYLRHHGVSFAAIAGMVALARLPDTWRVLIGPAVDVVSTPTRWYLVAVGLAFCSTLALGFVAGHSAAMPIIDALAPVTGFSSAALAMTLAVVMVQTSPTRHRGGVAGWVNAGQLGGVGIGGGAALWIAISWPGGIALASLLVALAAAPCVAPLLWLRPARVISREGLKVRAAGVGRAIAGLMRTRAGVLVALFSLAPTGLNEAANLMPALAGDWRAPATIVALMSGMVGGLVSIPGCLLGGYLCRRFSPKAVYIGAGLACALIEPIIAFSPRTPESFAVLVMLNAAIVGTSWAAITGVVFEILGEKGAATVASFLSSLANAPIVVMAMVVGALQQRFGSGVMFLGEAGIAVACLAGLTILTLLWRPRRPAWPVEEAAVLAGS